MTKVCTSCGKEFPATLEYFRKDKRTPTGLGARCKGCARGDACVVSAVKKGTFKPSPVKLGDSKGCLSTLYLVYKKGAAKRGYEFSLTKEEFAGFTKRDCWYCGRKPAQIKRHYPAKNGNYYIYNGIDRVDNNKGYVLANCIPCCGTCNRMKNVLPGDVFISHIREITEHLGL